MWYPDSGPTRGGLAPNPAKSGQKGTKTNPNPNPTSQAHSNSTHNPNPTLVLGLGLGVILIFEGMLDGSLWHNPNPSST